MLRSSDLLKHTMTIAIVGGSTELFYYFCTNVSLNKKKIVFINNIYYHQSSGIIKCYNLN